MDAASLLFLTLLFALIPGSWRTVEAVSSAQIIEVRSSILTHYDRTHPPPGGQVQVQLYVDVLNVDLYAYAEYMSIECLVYFAWSDSRLSWTDSDVESIDIYTDEIWVPDVGVLHRWEDDPEDSSLPNTRCVLSSVGHVQCMPPAEFRSHCTQDLSRWPYSLHNCTLRLASKLPVQQLKFDLLEVVFVYELASRNWDEMQIIHREEEVTEKSNVAITFILQRRSLLQTAAFVAPAFVLALLTVSSWFLPSSCNERLLLATLSVFLHCVVINSLVYAMPENGPSAPQVVLMYRDLLVVAAASFMAAVGLRGLSELCALDSPVWLSTVLESAPAQLLLCAPHGSHRLQEEDDAEGLVNEEEQTTPTPATQAVSLTRLMNRLGLLASAATCIAALSIRLTA